MTTMESLMKEALQAPEERKAEAIRVLRGEVPEAAARPVTGPLLLGMGEAAKLLGVSRPTLWRILQVGTIVKVELFPGSYRVRREDVEALAAGKFGLSEKTSKRGRPKKNVDQSAVNGGAEVGGGVT